MKAWESEVCQRPDIHFIFIAGSLLKSRPEVRREAEKAARRGRKGEGTIWGWAGKECAGLNIHSFSE